MQEQTGEFIRLSKAAKRELKFQKSKIRHKIVRSKVAKKVRQKVKQLQPELKEQYHALKKQADTRSQLAYESGIPVYLDLEYDVLMNDREIRSLALQVAHIVGINKSLTHPVQIHLTNVIGLQKIELEKQGLNSWLIHYSEFGLQEVVESNKQNKEFIYLSPDADEYLDTVDPNKYIYIVGGFVDRQVQKYMSLNKASTLQIGARKLPIEKYVQGNRRPLNIDTVVAILSLYHTHNDWGIAYNKALEFNVSVVENLLKQQQQQAI